MLIQYQDFNFRPATLTMIEQANGIIAEYEQQGYTLTLRQLHYQFVSRDLMANTFRNYKKLGTVMNDARLAGLVSWTAIEDRGRSTALPYVKDDVASIVDSIRYHFAADFWKNQPRYIEVWVEKDALSSIVEKACDPLRTPYMACKGYLSVSEMWRAGLRMKKARRSGHRPLVIHLGDHDPSGIDMTRDNLERLRLLSEGTVEVQRIALNRDQIDQYDPPPNPTKITDSRAQEYLAEHGDTSWELDALEPSVLRRLIEETIRGHIDFDAWAESEEEEREGTSKLELLADNWPEVEEFLNNNF